MSRVKLVRGVIVAGVAALALLLVILAVGCGGSASTTTPSTATTAPQTNFAKTAKMMTDFLNSDSVKPMSATELNTILTDGNPNNDPVVIDVRDQADYAKASSKSPGHIKGAINVPFRKLADPANVSKISTALASHADKTIVVHCYTGHTQSITMPVLYELAQTGKLGTPAPKIVGLDWGMMGYNTVETPPTYNNTFPLETKANTPAASASLPSVTNDFLTQAQAVLTNMPGRLNVDKGAQTVNKKPLTDYTIVDIRSADEYAKGHMPGAINVEYHKMFNQENGAYPGLDKISTSKQILVVGDTQYTEEFVAVGLNLLNIDQSKFNTGALGFGIATWNNTVGRKFTAADKHTYPVVTGATPDGS